MLTVRLQRRNLVLERIRALERVRPQTPPARAVLSLERELVHSVELVLDVLHLLADPIIDTIEIIVLRVDVIKTEAIFAGFFALLRSEPSNAAASLN